MANGFSYGAEGWSNFGQVRCGVNKLQIAERQYVGCSRNGSYPRVDTKASISGSREAWQFDTRVRTNDWDSR